MFQGHLHPYQFYSLAGVDELIKDIVESFTEYATTGTQALAKSSRAVSDMDRSFDGEFDKVSLQSHKAENISAYVEKIAREVSDSGHVDVAGLVIPGGHNRGTLKEGRITHNS